MSCHRLQIQVMLVINYKWIIRVTPSEITLHCCSLHCTTTYTMMHTEATDYILGFANYPLAVLPRIPLRTFKTLRTVKEMRSPTRAITGLLTAALAVVSRGAFKTVSSSSSVSTCTQNSIWSVSLCNAESQCKRNLPSSNKGWGL